MTETTYRKFLREFATSVGAGISLFAVRSKEPHAAARALREFSKGNGREYRQWDVCRGWVAPGVSTPDTQTQDIGSALAHLENRTGANALPEKLCGAMFWPHSRMNLPPIIQALAHIGFEWPLRNEERCLVLLVPETYTLPPELQELVHVIDYGLPTQAELRERFAYVSGCFADEAEGVTSPLAGFTDEHKDAICAAGAGMTTIEFETALTRAVIEAEEVVAQPGGAEKVRQHVLRIKTEAVRRGNALEVERTVAMDAVGGADLYKAWLQGRRAAFSKEAQEAGVPRPKGALLVGPPGTGKSLLAKATGAVLGLPVIRFNLSSVFGGLVGASEENTRKALATLAAMAPCVAFVDELDKMFGQRQGGGDSGVGERVLGLLLTFMQESEAPIFWLPTANRALAIPAELVRAGRIDATFAVSMPGEVERREIFGIHLRKVKYDPADVVGLDDAVVHTAGFSGAEIEVIVKEAATEAFATEQPISGAMLLRCMAGVKPLSVSHREDFNAMAEWCAANARPSSSYTEAGMAVVEARGGSAPGAPSGQPRRRVRASVDG